MDKFFIIDGSSYIYRAYYGVPRLNNSKGFPTNAIYGFLKMLKNTLVLYKPKYLLIALDSKEASFRKNIYSEYKANRKTTPDDLLVQIPHIYRLIQTMNITSLSIESIEADDIIASFVKKFSNTSSINIVSGDKDLLQLVDDKICMIDTMKNTKYCTEDVVKKFGVLPQQVKDYLAIAGDASDNIPGIKGIGPKGATKLLNEFTNIDGIYKNIDSIKNPKLKNTLLDNKESAYLSLKLVELKYDLEVNNKLEDFLIKNYNTNEYINFLKEFEFYSELKSAYAQQEKQTNIFETKTPNKNEHDVYTILINGEYIGYDFISRFSSEWLFNNKFFDIKLAYYLLNPGKREYPIDEIAYKFAGNSYSSELLQTIKNNLCIELEKFNLTKVYYGIDKPCIPILKAMSENGILLDINELEKLKKEYLIETEKLTKIIYELSDEEFNINSPKQLSYILFEKLQLPTLKKISTGFSTNQEVLEELSFSHKLPKFIIEYRELSKLLNTYIDPLLLDAKNNKSRVHTTYTLDVTATGRLSSINPNLQNIPIKSDSGSKIRKVFTASKGNVLISADYSQIELRILSYLSNDLIMQEAFKNNEDIHIRTASEIFDVDINFVNSEQRRQAKAINFGIMYGKTPYGLSKELGIPINIAKLIINRYFERYSGIAKYREELIEKVKKDGISKTYFGRIRLIPEIFSKNKNLRDFAERNAINSPIQGTASDILKIAMINLSNKLRLSNLEAKIIMHVHDELVVEASIKDKEAVVSLVKEIMENAVNFEPKLCVDIKTGFNLLDLD